MPTSPRTILIAAAVVGIAGDTLLRGGIWRIGFALWVAGIVGIALSIGERPSGQRLLLFAGLVLAAFGLVFRDSELLYAIDLLSVLCMGALTIWYGTGKRVADLTVVETARVGILAAFNTLAGAAGVIGNGIDGAAGVTGGKAHLRAIVIGSVLAIPPIFIVGGLLASSDAVFDGVLERFFTSVVSEGLAHLLLAAVLTWVATGWLRAGTGDAIGGSLPNIPSPRLSYVSVSVPLYALGTLLVAFIVTQARVLFGGAAFLSATQGLTVANYARDGFFQLLLAAGVVLLTLVVAEWMLPVEDDSARQQYSIIGTILLGLVTTLLVSAAVRIWLYVSEFGLSVDRLFASGGILWVLMAIVTVALTTLRGQPARFMPTIVVATIVWVAMLNLFNPEAVVVRANVARATAGQDFDATYHASLSGDALPTLRALAPRLSGAQCVALETQLHKAWQKRLDATSDNSGRDWRSRNVPLIRGRAWLSEGAHLCAAARTAAVESSRPAE